MWTETKRVSWLFVKKTTKRKKISEKQCHMSDMGGTQQFTPLCPLGDGQEGLGFGSGCKGGAQLRSLDAQTIN